MNKRLFSGIINKYRAASKRLHPQFDLKFELRINGRGIKWPLQQGTLQNMGEQPFNCSMGILNSAVKAIEAKDHYTRGHSDRVATLSLEIANILDLDCSPADVEIAARLHDIGKIGISDKILTKPGALTADEMAEIRKHPLIGADILMPLDIFEHIIPTVRHHHERFDGTGYPDGLAGNDIPILARIIAVADTFDALTSDRPYRKAMSAEQALNIIRQAQNSQLDPDCVSGFLQTSAANLQPQSGRKPIHKGACLDIACENKIQ